jgi:hypothetical protein
MISAAAGGSAQGNPPDERAHGEEGERGTAQPPRAAGKAPTPVDPLARDGGGALAPVLEGTIDLTRRQHGQAAHGGSPG